MKTSLPPSLQFKRKAWLLVINTFVLISLALNVQAKTIEGKVIGVSDGDTITVLKRKTPYKIRLDGIDCPEKTQAFGNRAKQFTSDMAFGKSVRVEITKKDRYGRSLGEVFLPDGQSLNKELLKSGFAWHYKYYSKDLMLSNLEDDARKKKIGLWSDKHPTPPWEYRRKNHY